MAAQDGEAIPRASLQKLITELLPPDMKCAPETRDIIQQCCTEFIHLLAGEANDISTKDKKKVMAPEHVVEALKSLGFAAYVPDVETMFDEHKTAIKQRPKMKTLKDSGLTEEEMQKEQERLFAAARLATGMGAGAGSAPVQPQPQPQPQALTSVRIEGGSSADADAAGGMIDDGEGMAGIGGEGEIAFGAGDGYT